MKLKDLRLRCGIAQPAAAELVGIPFRTYCRYEVEEAYEGSFKYAQIVKMLEDCLRDKALSLDEIRAAVSSSCSNYPVNACYLFGSHAKGKPTGRRRFQGKGPILTNISHQSLYKYPYFFLNLGWDIDNVSRLSRLIIIFLNLFDTMKKTGVH